MSLPTSIPGLDAKSPTIQRAGAVEGRASDAAADPSDRLERLLVELESLIERDVAPESFHDRLLAAALQESGACAATLSLNGECVCAVSDGLEPGAVTPGSNDDRSTAIVGVATLPVYSDLAVSIELRTRRSPLALQPQFVHPVAEAFAELARDYYRQRHLQQLQRRQRAWAALDRFIGAIHRAPLPETAVAIVNEMRALVDCDRVSLFQVGVDGRSCKLMAVNAVDEFDRRSPTVRRLQDFAAAAAGFNEPVWNFDDSQQRPPQLESVMVALVEESHARLFGAVPLCAAADPSSEATCGEHTDNAPTGVLVLEWYTVPSVQPEHRERIQHAARHAAIALDQSLRTERLPLIGICRRLSSVVWITRARRRPLLVGALVLLVMTAGLAFVPATLHIAADGELRPVERRQVFAPDDAVVDQILVDHGDEVTVGQPLLSLRSAALDYEKTRLDGEIQTAEQRLAALQTARFQPSDSTNGAAARRLELTADEAEAKQLLQSLTQQRQRLEEQIQQLDIRAPLNGQVLTWDAKQVLAGRPVSRGQLLLAVARTSGAWEAELQVADERIGYVMKTLTQARRENRPVTVELMVAGGPNHVYRGEIDRVALRSQIDEHQRVPVVRVTVRLADVVLDPRPRAAVVARIDCGQHSLASVWFGEAWHSLRRRLLF